MVKKGSEYVKKTIKITTEFITLGQFLKHANVIQSGGMAKVFLNEHEVYINGVLDQRRGRKVRIGDQVDIPHIGTFFVSG